MEQDEDVSNVDGKTQTVEDPPVLHYQINMWFQIKTLLTSILLLIALCFGANAKQARHETWIDIGAIVVEVGPGVVAAIRRGEVLGKLDFSKPLAKTQAPSVNYASPGGVAGNNASVAGKGATNNGPRITIRDHYKHHNAMRTEIIDQLEGQGFRVSPGEASFGSSCGVGRCRPDIIYRTPDGQVRIIEIKTGNADPSIRQTEIYPQISNGDAIPRGKVAANFGLEPNVPLRKQGYPNGIPIEIYRFRGAGQ